ncbi:MAG TPA: DMT family transporter [Hyphomicrobium sp.]|nr:DMT family transporter [Hyphomicrobium sp.]
MSSRSRFIGYALAACGAALFSTKAIFIKLAYQDRVDAALMLAWRMIFALPFYAAIGWWAMQRRRAEGKASADMRTIVLACVTGFLGYYMASQFDFAGLQYISAQLERLVLFTYPVFIMFLGAAIGGPPVTLTGLTAAAITYAGLAFVFAADLPEGGRDTAWGTLLVLGAAITFAAHHLLAKRILPALGSALFTSIALATASFFCILHQAIAGNGDFSAPARFLWLSAGCAVVATVLPTFLINAGLSRSSPQSVAMISSVSPLVTIALAVAILGEAFTLADAAGSALVLAGVGLFTWGEGR